MLRCLDCNVLQSSLLNMPEIGSYALHCPPQILNAISKLMDLLIIKWKRIEPIACDECAETNKSNTSHWAHIRWVDHFKYLIHVWFKFHLFPYLF